MSHFSPYPSTSSRIWLHQPLHGPSYSLSLFPSFLPSLIHPTFLTHTPGILLPLNHTYMKTTPPPPHHIPHKTAKHAYYFIINSFFCIFPLASNFSKESTSYVYFPTKHSSTPCNSAAFPLSIKTTFFKDLPNCQMQ